MDQVTDTALRAIPVRAAALECAGDTGKLLLVGIGLGRAHFR